MQKIGNALLLQATWTDNKCIPRMTNANVFLESLLQGKREQEMTLILDKVSRKSGELEYLDRSSRIIHVFINMIGKIYMG